MNWCEVFTETQKQENLSARFFLNFVFGLFSLNLALTSPQISAQTNASDFYLAHSVLIDRHIADTTPVSHKTTYHHSLNIEQLYVEQLYLEQLSDLDSSAFEDEQPYYFAFDKDSCHIDPFASGEDSPDNRQILATCLRNQLWENKNIPMWIRATGATVLIGAAGSAGKVDDDLKFSVGFDKVDSLLRNWLNNPTP